MADNEQTIDMGPGTYAIPLSLFHDNRLRVCSALKAASKEPIDQNVFILLQGGDAISLYNTDVEYLFRQVRWNTIFFSRPLLDNEIISEAFFRTGMDV